MQEHFLKIVVFIMGPFFYYQYEIYDGKEDVKRVTYIFSPNNSLTLFKSFEVKR